MTGRDRKTYLGFSEDDVAVRDGGLVDLWVGYNHKDLINVSQGM